MVGLLVIGLGIAIAALGANLWRSSWEVLGAGDASVAKMTLVLFGLIMTGIGAVLATRKLRRLKS